MKIVDNKSCLIYAIFFTIFFKISSFASAYAFESQLLINNLGKKSKLYHIGINGSSVKLNGYLLASGIAPLVQKSLSNLAFPNPDSATNCIGAKYSYKFKRPDQKLPSTIKGCIDSNSYTRLENSFIEIQGFSKRD